MIHQVFKGDSERALVLSGGDLMCGEEEKAQRESNLCQGWFIFAQKACELLFDGGKGFFVEEEEGLLGGIPLPGDRFSIETELGDEDLEGFGEEIPIKREVFCEGWQFCVLSSERIWLSSLEVINDVIEGDLLVKELGGDAVVELLVIGEETGDSEQRDELASYLRVEIAFKKVDLDNAQEVEDLMFDDAVFLHDEKESCFVIPTAGHYTRVYT